MKKQDKSKQDEPANPDKETQYKSLSDLSPEEIREVERAMYRIFLRFGLLLEANEKGLNQKH